MEFVEFPKMARWSKDVVVTEKIDGTNAQILITEDKQLICGSRNRFITPEDDNAGFAKWAHEHKDELIAGLGVGRHFGEWWGSGIQRGYGLKEKRFSLFNTIRWCKHDEEPKQIATEDPRVFKVQEKAPACCGIVPILFRGSMDDLNINAIMEDLKEKGSYASKGFMRPEGIVIFHVAACVGFKKTFEKDCGKWIK